MRHSFQTEAWFPHPLETVFGFFADPQNLPRIMPAWQKAEIESARLVSPPELPHAAGAGSEMWISFRPLPFLPLRAHWRARISEFAYLAHFCDLQLAGPFRSWHHCHRFRAERRGTVDGTRVRDELTYTLPLALVSDLLRPLTQLNLAAIFLYRQRETARLLRYTA